MLIYVNLICSQLSSMNGLVFAMQSRFFFAYALLLTRNPDKYFIMYRINAYTNDLPWPHTVDMYPSVVLYPAHRFVLFTTEIVCAIILFSQM